MKAIPSVGLPNIIISYLLDRAMPQLQADELRVLLTIYRNIYALSIGTSIDQVHPFSLSQFVSDGIASEQSAQQALDNLLLYGWIVKGQKRGGFTDYGIPRAVITAAIDEARYWLEGNESGVPA